MACPRPAEAGHAIRTTSRGGALFGTIPDRAHLCLMAGTVCHMVSCLTIAGPIVMAPKNVDSTK